MLLVDEDVRDGRLAGLLFKVVLDLATIRSFVEPEHYGELRKELRMKGERTL